MYCYSYSLNSMYYLLLKADRVGVASHPVTSTLLLLRKVYMKAVLVVCVCSTKIACYCG